MNISEVTTKHKLSKRDANLAKMLHNGKDHTEEEWLEILKPDFHFPVINTEAVVEEPVKEEKKAEDTTDKKDSKEGSDNTKNKK